MFIKFTYKNTTRKLKKEIKTMEELKSQALKAFGNDVLYCDYMYEDEDNEMVNIIDDSDLVACYEEAEENGKKSVKVILKLSSPTTKRARSISQKKKNVVFVDEDTPEEELEGFGTSSSDEAEDIEDVLEGFSDEMEDEVEIEAEIGEENFDQEIEGEDEERKREVEEIINAKFNKLEEKMQRKLRKLKDKRPEQLGTVKRKFRGVMNFLTGRKRKERREKRRHGKHHHGKHHHGKHRHGRRGRGGRRHWKKHVDGEENEDRQGMPDFVKEIIEENKKHGFPWKQVKAMICEVKDELKTFKGSPELISKTIEKCKDQIISFAKNAVEEVKTENPELVAELEKKREEREAKKEERRKAGIERREQKKIKREKKFEEKKKKLEEKLQKKKDKILKKVEKKLEKEAAKNSSPDKSNPRKEEIKKRMTIVVPIFKNIPRPELRKAVVKDYNQGNDIQVTIKKLFETQEE